MNVISLYKKSYSVPLTKTRMSFSLLLFISTFLLSSISCSAKESSSAKSTAVMSNLPGLIELTIADADNILGQPYKIEETPTQESAPRLPSGGEMRYYDFDGFDISLLFDKQDQVSKAVFVWGGLAAYEFSLDKVTDLLATVGLSISSEPDFSTGEGVTWYDHDGFQIYLALGHKTGDHQYARGGIYIDRIYIAQLP